jgi:hypothetical protein
MVGDPQIRLTIELVPSTCWFSNVRSAVTKADWDRLRKAVYAEAKNRCEVCGGQGKKHPVECHEVWDYDAANRIQRLVRLLALCPACHEVKHIGYAEVRGRMDNAVRHLAKVNGWTIPQAIRYVGAQFEVWAARSKFAWTLDIAWLERRGVDVAKILKEKRQTKE